MVITTFDPARRGAGTSQIGMPKGWRQGDLRDSSKDMAQAALQASPSPLTFYPLEHPTSLRRPAGN